MKRKEVVYRAGMVLLAAVFVLVVARGTCGKPKPCQPPMLLEPANGARLEEKRPSFRWEALDGIKEYQIEIADNEMFDQVMVQTTVMGTSYKPMTDMADGSYYWHVRGKRGKGMNDLWSTRFGTGAHVVAIPSPPNPGGPWTGRRRHQPDSAI